MPDQWTNDQLRPAAIKGASPLFSPLWILTFLAVIAALYVAQAFVVPLLIGILASYTLYPIVDWMAAHRVARGLAAALVVAILTGALSWIAYSLSDDVAAMVEKLPEAARKLRLRISDGHSPGLAPLQNVQEAARELEKAAATAAGEKVPPRAAPPTAVQSTSVLRDYVLAQSAVVASSAGKIPFVLLLIYFLLASGTHFRRKVVRIFGKSISEKKEVLALLEEIEVQVQRFMLVMLFTNTLIGGLTWIAFTVLGVDNAELWGVAAGILHFIPYLGPTLVAIASAVAAFLQFGTILKAALVALVASAIAGGVGMIFMTWLQSRFSRINAAMLFIALLFFGWLWGVWGLLLGAPLVAITKVVCDRVEGLKPIGELLGLDGPAKVGRALKS